MWVTYGIFPYEKKVALRINILFHPKFIQSIKFHPKFISGRESMYSVVGKEIEREKLQEVRD